MFSKTYTHFLLALALVVAVLTLAPAALNAQDYWGKRTLITVNKPFEVPGKVIPPGRYILEIVGLQAERNVVRISDEAGKVFATVIAIPDYRRQATDNTVLTFYEAAPGAPEPLRQWFYPGDRIGVEFAYPKRRAVEIATQTREHVIAESAPPAPATAPAPTVAELLEEPVVAIAPTGEEVPVATVHPAAPAAPAPVVAAAPPPTLPKTATPLPLIALIGAASTAAALVLRRYAK